MRVRLLVVALSAITSAVCVTTAVAALAASSPAAASCSKSAIAPYVHGVRAAAASFIADLAKAGGSRLPMSTITITLSNSQRLVFTFTGSHFRVSGTGLPTACRKLPQDDWLQ